MAIVPDQLYLNFNGRALRDAGIKVAAENAESKSPGWGERAVAYVKEYTCYHVEFLAEDVREFAETNGFRAPLMVSSRCWGHVMVSAARLGIIRKVGVRVVKNPKAHVCYATLWRRV